MTDDLNRKTLRQFQCRDYLWEAFEQMSQELECSVDYLVNEAMRHYARGQGKLRQTTAAPGMRTNVPGMPQNAPPQPSAPQQHMTPQPPVAQQQPPPPRPMPPANQGGPPGVRPGAPPPLVGANGGQRPAPPMYGGAQAPRMPSVQQPPQPQYPQQPPQPQYPQQPPQPQYPQQPPQRQAFGQPQPQQQPGGAILYAVYEGQKYPVNKEEFFIGRSNKTCDLIVKDPNVSRQHARIVRHGGQFWMLDMGSTNGIEYQGGRVDRHVISEGDVFKICDHDIVFTYR